MQLEEQKDWTMLPRVRRKIQTMTMRKTTRLKRMSRTKMRMRKKMRTMNQRPAHRQHQQRQR
jgi:hypothetical protein